MRFWKKLLFGCVIGFVVIILSIALGTLRIFADMRAYIQDMAQQRPTTHVAAVKRDLTVMNGIVHSVHRFLPAKYQADAMILNDFNTWAQTLLTGHHKVVLLFQNSDELRATGGFMGSYAIVELSDGAVTRMDVQDIYVADGQFHGFVDPPPGVKEYLSGGNGLRLPDANWNPDLPSSARDILQFFDAAGEHRIDELVTVNLSVAEGLLKIVGNVELPDFHTTVTADNLAAVAQVDPATFFPGSQQKKNFLSSLFVGLKLKMTQLSNAQQRAVIQMAIHELTTKNVQLFALDQSIENLYQKYAVGGIMRNSDPSAFYFYPVESNVGINKANRVVTRQIQLDVSDSTVTATLQFQNNNFTPQTASPSARPLQYVDYQRVFVSPTAKVNSIEVGDQNVSHWDEQIVTAANGQQFKQLGFLIVVPEQTQMSAIVSFVAPKDSTRIELQKQSGIPDILYRIHHRDTIMTFSLDRDETLTY